MELIVFILASAMVIAGAVGVIVRSNPVHAALSLVLTLFGIAVHFVALEAHFLAAVQIIVYAGAIVVLFLFVIMLLGVDKADDLTIEPLPVQRPLAVVVGAGLIALVIAAFVRARDTLADASTFNPANPEGLPLEADGDRNIQQLAQSLFGDYVFAFEFTSVLLIIAVAGTVLLTRKEKKDKEVAS